MEAVAVAVVVQPLAEPAPRAGREPDGAAAAAAAVERTLVLEARQQAA